MSGKSENNAVEPEITPEMIEAGCAELAQWEVGAEPSGHIVESVFLAMIGAAAKKRKNISDAVQTEPDDL
jgi:hypothetical protein